MAGALDRLRFFEPVPSWNSKTDQCRCPSRADWKRVAARTGQRDYRRGPVGLLRPWRHRWESPLLGSVSGLLPAGCRGGARKLDRTCMPSPRRQQLGPPVAADSSLHLADVIKRPLTLLSSQANPMDVVYERTRRFLGHQVSAGARHAPSISRATSDAGRDKKQVPVDRRRQLFTFSPRRLRACSWASTATATPSMATTPSPGTASTSQCGASQGRPEASRRGQRGTVTTLEVQLLMSAVCCLERSPVHSTPAVGAGPGCGRLGRVRRPLHRSGAGWPVRRPGRHQQPGRWRRRRAGACCWAAESRSRRIWHIPRFPGEWCSMHYAQKALSRICRGRRVA